MASSAWKYLVIFLFGGAMFFLGVLVGRGSAPVSFDTRAFQKQVAAIVEEVQAAKVTPAKPDLVFYDVLKKPVRTGVKASDKAGEILPAGSNETGALWNGSAGLMPSEIKRSRKSMTLNQAVVKESLKEDTKEPQPQPVAVVQAKKRPGSAEPPAPKKVKPKDKAVNPIKPVTRKFPAGMDKGEPEKSLESYAIQVAAFKNMKDAIGQVETLRARGFTTYRTMGSVGNVIWHRVRIGPFSDKKKAQTVLKGLKGEGFNAMILENEKGKQP